MKNMYFMSRVTTNLIMLYACVQTILIYEDWRLALGMLLTYCCTSIISNNIFGSLRFKDEFKKAKVDFISTVEAELAKEIPNWPKITLKTTEFELLKKAKNIFFAKKSKEELDKINREIFVNYPRWQMHPNSLKAYIIKLEESML